MVLCGLDGYVVVLAPNDLLVAAFNCMSLENAQTPQIRTNFRQPGVVVQGINRF